jgi:nitrite reductase (NADH) small subunit
VKGEEVDVGRVEDFPTGACRIVTVQGREIGIIHAGHGRFYAALNHCPHRGGPVCEGRLGGTMLPTQPGSLVYGMQGQVLQCPWHGWEFDLETGKTMFSISNARLKMYSVLIEDGKVRLHLGREKNESEG